MNDVYVIGADTLKFGRYLDLSVKDLAQQTTLACLQDAGLNKQAIQALWFSNSAWGNQSGQDCIRGQVALRPIGIEGIPISNIENACAGGSTAAHHAWLGVASGLYDITMAVGAEKLYSNNKMATFTAFFGGLDIEDCINSINTLAGAGLTESEQEAIKAMRQRYPASVRPGKPKSWRTALSERLKSLRDGTAVAVALGEKIGYKTLYALQKRSSGEHSPFMDIYGHGARLHMRSYGLTIEQLAKVAVKAHFNGSLNPKAQYQFKVSVEDVLRDRLVSFPITRSMCAPIGDGAASAIFCSEATVHRLGLRSQAVKVRASILGSGCSVTQDQAPMPISKRLANLAYEKAGLGPSDVDLAEVHDATSFGEIIQAEHLGFCEPGQGGVIAERGETALGGRIPINTSGGLTSRGHPVGASGLAQLYELVMQLRGQCGVRQVSGARIAMSENGGGALGHEEAAMCMHILEAPGRG